MKSEASRIGKKMLKLKRAFKALVRAILAHPIVEKVFGVMLIIYWGLGFLGFAWVVISFGAVLISGFESGGIADWLRDFVKACPWLSLVWLFITVTTCWMFLYPEKKQTSPADQAEVKQ